MSRDRVMPSYFRELRRGSSPWAATLTMSALNLLLLGLALGTTSVAAALTNAASSLGLISIVFYGITAAAALWQQRGTLLESMNNLLFGGVLPFIGAAFSVWVLVEAVYTGAVSVTVMLYGLGSIGLGAMVAIFLHRIQRNEFFTP
jgi:amino acid transporter